MRSIIYARQSKFDFDRDDKHANPQAPVWAIVDMSSTHRSWRVVSVNH